MNINNKIVFNGGKLLKIKDLENLNTISNSFDTNEAKQTENPNPTYNNYDFFSSGSYGCTMFPNMRCDGIKTKRIYPRHMSKLSIKGFYSENEYNIGQKLLALKKNKQHNSILEHMNFMEKKCEIKKKKIHVNTEKYDCSILDSDKYKSERDFVLFKTKYIQSSEISSYLNKNFSVKLMLRYYYFMLKCIQFLLKHDILHHDMHMSNVLIDTKYEFHLIDFGIAIDYKKCFNSGKLNMEYIKNILIVFDPSWNYWPIEYHILCYFVFRKTELTKKELEKIVETYYGKNKVFNKYFKNMKNYKKAVVDFYSKKYVNNDNIEKHIKEILETSYHTWDLYQVNIILLILIDLYDIKEMHNIIDLCKIGLHYDASKRYNIDFFLKTFISVLRNYKQTPGLLYSSEIINSTPKKTEYFEKLTKTKKTTLYVE